jgi:hypothetical protein
MAEFICDFCLGPDPVWDYPTAPIHDIEGPSPFTALAGDGFACCRACHALLLRGDIVGLAERIVREQPVNVPPGSEKDGGIVVYPHRGAHRGYAMQAILRFMDARTGPPVRL